MPAEKTHPPVIDTIAILTKEGYKNLPPFEDASNAVTDRFEHDYLSVGKTYPFFFGGDHVGKVTVGPTGSAEECSGLESTASLQNNIAFSSPMMGLAASQDIFHTHPNPRRRATPQEQSQVLNLVRNYLREHGIDPKLLAEVKIEDLVTTRVRAACTASLCWLSPVAKVIRRVMSYHLGRDIEYRTDDQIEQFVDQLDLDGDGTDEIVTIFTYYESHEYVIYKKYHKAGQPDWWAKLYQGGGGGC